MKRKIFFIFISLILFLLLASCANDNVEIAQQDATKSDITSDEEQSHEDKMIEPEQLISKQEASELLGEPMDNGEKTEMTSIGQKTVFYDSAQEGSLGFLQISITQQSFIPSGSSITPEETYQGAKAGLDKTSDLDLNSIGDDCFTGTPGLHVLSDGYYIVISAGNTNDPVVQGILEKAGELAVANLRVLTSG